MNGLILDECKLKSISIFTECLLESLNKDSSLLTDKQSLEVKLAYHLLGKVVSEALHGEESIHQASALRANKLLEMLK